MSRNSENISINHFSELKVASLDYSFRLTKNLKLKDI